MVQRIISINGNSIVVKSSEWLLGKWTNRINLLQLVYAFGAEALVTDVIDYQLEVARKLGASGTFNTQKEDGYKKEMQFTNNRGVDIAFECAGSKHTPTTVPQAASYTRIGGKVCFVGGFDPDMPPIKLDWERIQKGDIQLIPSASYSWGIYPEMLICIDLMASGKIDAKKLITHRFKLDDINEAFTVTSDKEKTTLFLRRF